MKHHRLEDAKFSRSGRHGQDQIQPTNYPPLLLKCLIACMFGTFSIGYQSNVMHVSWKVHDRWLDEWYWQYIDKEHTPATLWLLKQYLQCSFYSTFVIGGIIGSYLAASYANKEGVKQAIHSSAIPATFAYTFICVTGLLEYISFLYIGRLFIGVHCGFLSVLIYCYLLELTRRQIRGQCFALCQVGYATGVMLAASLGHQDLLGRLDNLDIYMSFSVLTYAGQWLMMSHICPIAPRDFYIKQDKLAETRDILGKLCYKQQEIEETIRECLQERKYIWESRYQIGPANRPIEIILSRGLRKQTRIAICVQLVYQMSTINLLMASSSRVLENRKFTFEMANRTAIVAGIGLVVASVWSWNLIQKYGRRTLLLAGLMGIIVTQIYLTLVLLYVHDKPTIKPVPEGRPHHNKITGELTLDEPDEKFKIDMSPRETCYQIGLFLFSMAYAIGPLVITPLYTAELFTQESRFASVSLSVTIGWLFSFFEAAIIPIADYYMGSFIFIPFILGIAACSTYVHRDVLETKDMDLIAISELYREVKYQAYELQVVAARSRLYNQGCANVADRNLVTASDKHKGRGDAKSVRGGETEDSYKLADSAESDSI